MISILILTHNRPKLFERAIKSVLDNLPDYPVEIIVNNDSNDIEEISGATYYYEKHEDLSHTYKFLLDKATQEYIYFLEDDDYLLPKFFSKLDFSYDINFINYRHEDVNEAIERFNREFAIEEEDFQFGQIVFKKSLVTKVPSGNIETNDWVFFNTLKGSTKLISDILWVQTTDGNDNISFPELNVDDRFRKKGFNLGIGGNPFTKQGYQHTNPYFSEVVWNILTLCDYKCYYCTERRVGRERDDYWNKLTSFNNQKRIVDALGKITWPFKLDIHGGEPLLLPRYHELIEYIQNNAMSHPDSFISVTTNGSRPIEWWEKLKYYPQMEYAFSYHVTEVSDDDEFIQKVRITKDKGYNSDINVMLSHSSKYWSRTEYIIEQAEKYGIHIAFGYLFANRGATEFGEEYLYKYDKDYWNWISQFDHLEPKRPFYAEELEYSIPLKDIYLKGYNQFKGWSCHTYNFHITQEGKVLYRTRCSDPVGSIGLGNLLENVNYFKNFKLEPFICPQDYCSYDLYLEYPKEKI